MDCRFSSEGSKGCKRSRKFAYACSLLLFAMIAEAVSIPLIARASDGKDPRSDQERQHSYKIGGHEITLTDMVVAGVIAGQVLVDRAITGVMRAYYVVERDTFDEKIRSQMKQKPKKVLAVISTQNIFETVTAENQIMDNYRGYEFYGPNKNFELIDVSSPQDLIAKLKALPQDGRYDRIEFMLHGYPGLFIFSDGTILASPEHPVYGKMAGNALEALEKANLRITQPGAEIRLTSCTVARGLGPEKPVGRDFLNSFGKALLPEGGSVFASEKSIYMTRGIRFAEKLPIAGIIVQARGLTRQIKYLGIPNKFKSQQDLVRVDIAPSHPCKIVDSLRAGLSQIATPSH